MKLYVTLEGPERLLGVTFCRNERLLYHVAR
jgi:hypothetical protein